MKYKSLAMFVLLCISAGLQILNAQWVQTRRLSDLRSVSVYALAVSGANVFIGTDIGVLRSTDDGANWTLCNNGLTNEWVNTLAVKGDKIFAGTIGGGVFLSRDDGETWTAKNSGLTNANIYHLVVSGTKVYAATAWGGGVFVSTDDGSSWMNIGNGLSVSTVITLEISGGSIFAGTSSGVYRSDDNGVTWTQLKNGLSNSPVIFSLAFYGTKLFAGTGVRVSGSHGGSIEYGSGGYCSVDNGQNWAPVNIGTISNEINSFAVIGHSFFAASRQGVFLSTDNGINWTPVNTGLTSVEVSDLVVSGTYLFVGMSGGTVWKRAISDLPTAVIDDSRSIPSDITLEQNYPNPFNPVTTISFSLHSKSFVSLKIYDVMGREVGTLASEDLSAGNYARQWNASGIPSGIYFYRLTAGSYSQTKRLVLLR